MPKRISNEIRRQLKEAEDASSSSESEEAEPGEIVEERPRRGRRAIPLQWTRVMLVRPEEECKIQVQELFVDKELQKHLRRANKLEQLAQWQMLY